MGKCCRKCKVGSVMSALITRVVFALHCLIAIWRIMTNTDWNPIYWSLLAGLVGLAIESLITIYVRKGAEYKWFCPSVFFYLSAIVPCIWILELRMLDERIELKDKVEANLSDSLQQTITNVTLFNGKFTLPISIEPSQWVLMLEQLLLFILILGRWMLPKGSISREELSQLLLVYIGMAADIIEFFEAFKEEEVKYNYALIVTILAIWSASLFQFTLVLTASKAPKGRAGFQATADERPKEMSECCEGCFFCETEVFGIMTTILLQDGPFLALRLLLLARYNVRSYMHIFFTVKNSLVCLLMFYRLFVIYDSAKADPEDVDSLDHGDYIDLSKSDPGQPDDVEP